MIQKNVLYLVRDVNFFKIWQKKILPDHIWASKGPRFAVSKHMCHPVHFWIFKAFLVMYVSFPRHSLPKITIVIVQCFTWYDPFQKKFWIFYFLLNQYKVSTFLGTYIHTMCAHTTALEWWQGSVLLIQITFILASPHS